MFASFTRMYKWRWIFRRWWNIFNVRNIVITVTLVKCCYFKVNVYVVIVNSPCCIFKQGIVNSRFLLIKVYKVYIALSLAFFLYSSFAESTFFSLAFFNCLTLRLNLSGGGIKVTSISSSSMTPHVFLFLLIKVCMDFRLAFFLYVSSFLLVPL